MQLRCKLLFPSYTRSYVERRTAVCGQSVPTTRCKPRNWFTRSIFAWRESGRDPSWTGPILLP